MNTRPAVTLRWLFLRRGLWLRALFCWGLSCFILLNDETSGFDLRFQMRGDQRVRNEIVLIQLESSDLISNKLTRKSFWQSIKEVSEVTDSFYWDPQTWSQLLQKILAQNPTKVGVTLYFGQNLGPIYLTESQTNTLQDPRVVWAANSELQQRLNFPLLANETRTNTGVHQLLRDEDGVVRRFQSTETDYPHLLELLTNQRVSSESSKFINYRGGPNRFLQLPAKAILRGEIPGDFLKDKIILIGADNGASSQTLTPLGNLSRLQIMGQIADNLLADRWIKRTPRLICMMILLALAIVCIFVMTQYPQTVSLILLVWIATLWTALSLWVFDTFSLWLPIYSAVLLIAAIWIVFIGYQANKIERLNFQLKQEQKYLSELEQIKNNFVSLISHDLKTPIAKIQAIVDRLLLQATHSELKTDLNSLRSSSEELNRYIQSILRVLRVESRDFKLQKEIGDVNEIIEQALRQLALLAAEKKIEIKTELEPMFSVEMDLTLLREVMINLIDNAVKYTPSGGTITIRSFEQDDQVFVEVEDTGEGVHPDEMANVWGKFVRGKDQDMRTKGSGLGLYLVKYFIELHGGRVQMDSVLKKGTRVSFQLPIESKNEVTDG